MDSKLEITLFCKFDIKLDGKQILESLSNTRKTKLFLSYLLLHKKEAISHRELFELLWSGEDYANPGTALRTLLYRYRTLVDKAGITQLQNSIISKRGAYQWNQELDISIDIFDFEDYSHIGLNKAMSIEKRKECLRAAINLYKGGLLLDSSAEHWVVPRAVYYRDLYVKDVLTYIVELKKEKSYDEIIKLCKTALKLIGTNELLLLEQQIAENNGKVESSLQIVYEKMLYNMNQMDEETKNIQHNMEMDDEENTAFVCDYEMFKDIYHLQRRLLARTGNTMFFALMTMCKKSEGEYEVLRNERIMKSLLDSCRYELRCGDSICRYADNQYAIMFPADSFENAQRILERLKKAFSSQSGETDLILTYKIRPLKNAKE